MLFNMKSFHVHILIVNGIDMILILDLIQLYGHD